METELSLESRAHFAGLIFQSAPSPSKFLTFSNGNWALARVSCAFCRPHLPKVLRAVRAPSVFYDVYVKRALATVSCTFCRPLFPDRAAHPRKPLLPEKHRVSRPRVFSSLSSRIPDLSHFSTILAWWCGGHDDVADMMIEMMHDAMMRLPFSLFQVSSSFCQPHLPKVLRPAQSVSYDVYVKLSSCYSLVHILPTAFPDRAAHPRKHDPPSATTAATLQEKNTGFRAKECFQPEFTHSRSLTLPDYLHEDVVAMMIGVMMCLPSWWES